MADTSETRTQSGEAYTNLVLEVFRLNGRLLAMGEAVAAPFRLTSARWQVLGALRDGPLTVAAIARQMGLKRQSVQRVSDALAKEDCVVYIENPNHRRAMLAGLTDQGRSRLESVTQAWTRRANALSAAFDLESLLQAQALLRRVSEHHESQDREI